MRVVTAVLALLLAAASAQSAPTIYVDPATLTVDGPGPIEMSIRVDAGADTISAFLVRLEFDPDVVALAAASEGGLFAGDCQTLFDWDAIGPGVHSLNDVMLGASCYVLCPGELVRLLFFPTGHGTTGLSITAADLRDARRDPILPLFTEGAVVTVDPGTGVPDDPVAGPDVGPCSPNPFVAETRIAFSLPGGGSAAEAAIYDLAGRQVRRLAAPRGATGEIRWDGRAENGSRVPAGVYFVRLHSGGGSSETRVVKLH